MSGICAAVLGCRVQSVRSWDMRLRKRYKKDELAALTASLLDDLKRRGVSQNDVADDLGVAASQVSDARSRWYPKLQRRILERYFDRTLVEETSYRIERINTSQS